MRLDPRIKDAVYIADCFTATTYHKHIGKPCYFAQHIEEFCNLENCALDTLKSIDTITSFPFRSAGNTLSRFCLAAEFVEEKPEEKKYRPYTIEEFCNEGFEIIVFREKDCPSREFHLRYNGYRKCDNVYKVILGNISYTLSDLFEDFERFYNGRWFPFGVEE